MKDKEETYTVDELQEMWGVTKRRLIKFILEGKLKGKRIDKRHAYRVTKKDAEEFLKSGLIKSSWNNVSYLSSIVKWGGLIQSITASN